MEETQQTQVHSLCGQDPLEKKMGTRSSILASKSPWMEEPSRVKCVGCKMSDTIDTHTHILLIQEVREVVIVQDRAR